MEFFESFGKREDEARTEQKSQADKQIENGSRKVRQDL